MSIRTMFVAAGTALCLASPVNAQIAWDTPLLIAPADAPGFGVFLVETDGGGLGALGTWRSPSWNFGVRGGVAETRDDLGVFGGLDFTGTVVRESIEFPLNVDWVVGGGIGVGDGARISFPLGLIAGHAFRAENVVFTPYVSPRVVLDAWLDRDRPDPAPDDDDSDIDLGFAADIGLDIAMQGWLIRFGGTIGNREGVAIGLVF